MNYIESLHTTFAYLNSMRTIVEAIIGNENNGSYLNK